MSRIYYDWEFLEDGHTIEPISIGMVAEDGRELYLINWDAPLERIRNHAWLMENVVPSLPLALVTDGGYSEPRLVWNMSHPDYHKVVSRAVLAQAVHDFINAPESLPDGADGPDAELWGWYPAYDHVCLCQLWGSMIARPPGIPMQTFDVHQEAVRLGNPDLSDIGHNNGQEHHALADALECKARHEWLMANYDRKQYCCPDILREPGRPHEGPCLP